jgi:Zn-dependent protease
MPPMNSIQTFAVYALPILFAITLHEAAHAYAARYFGDNTAYSQGRMSLNPVRHIDPVGTLLIPIVLFFVGSPFLFGYARPVPIEYRNLRHPKRDMAWVALAGPAANLLMALLWMLLSVPPLDGGRILTSLLPNRAAYKFAQLESYGFFIVLALAMLGFLKYWMAPVMAVANTALLALISPLTYLLS